MPLESFSAVLFTADIKLEAKVELWIRQSLNRELVLEPYESLVAFRAAHRVVAAVAGEVPPALPDRKIAMFIIDIDAVEQQPLKWIAELQKWTHDHLRNRIDAVPRVLMMAYEGGAHRLETFQHESIDDLVLKPLDKLLFLQKCEFLLSDDVKLRPTFLFTADGLRMIEVGRDVTVDEISEFAVSVRSPSPLPVGSFAAIHCDAFGTKLDRRLIGRVYENVRHPVRAGEHLARFAFFGITTEQLSNLRRFIRANIAPIKEKSATAAPPAPVAKPALSLELRERMSKLKKRHFAVIDMSGVVLENARDIIESSFKGVSVRKFTSSARFLGELLKLQDSVSPDPLAGRPVAPAGLAFPSGKLVMILRLSQQDVIGFEPELTSEARVLGKPARGWMNRQGAVHQAMDPEDHAAFEEFLRFIGTGASAQLTVRMLNAENEMVFLDLRGAPLPRNEQDRDSYARIEMREITLDAWAQSGASSKRGLKPEDFRFEAILVDGRFLLPDPRAWFESLVAIMRKANVLGPTEAPPKIFVMGDPAAAVPTSSIFDPNMAPEAFRFEHFHDFSYKPLDRRLMILKFLEYWTDLLGLREIENSGFVPCELIATMGKDVLMDQLGEYGLAILHPTAFKERTFMRFFSQLFGEGGAWITGHCRYCETAGGNIGGALEHQQRCHFHFFGESDASLQRIRLWIRQDYVAGKG